MHTVVNKQAEQDKQVKERERERWREYFSDEKELFGIVAKKTRSCVSFFFRSPPSFRLFLTAHPLLPCHPLANE